MIKYCNKCGARYTEYIDDSRKLCADCKAAKEKGYYSKNSILSPKQIYQIWMNHAH